MALRTWWGISDLNSDLDNEMTNVQSTVTATCGTSILFCVRVPYSIAPTKQCLGHVQVRQAFLSRRKMLRNSLQIDQTSEQIGAALSSAGLSPDARAQDLTTQDFARFARCLGSDAITAP